MDLHFKIATIDDMELLLETRMEVLRDVFTLPADEDLSALREANRIYYSEKIPAGEHRALFAYAGEEIVATGALCFQQEMPSPDNPQGLCAYLMNIYTRSPFRKQGIGALMTDELVKHARQKGAGKIYLEATSAGRKVYENCGFLSLEDYLYLPIQP